MNFGADGGGKAELMTQIMALPDDVDWKYATGDDPDVTPENADDDIGI